MSLFMTGNVNVLRSELWGLMSGGESDAFVDIVDIKQQSVRLGTIEDILRSAIKVSSIGLYNGCLYFFGGRVYEPISWDEWKNVLTDLLFDYVKIPKIDYGQTYFISQRCTILVKSKRLEVNKNLMVFRNGVLDTETMEFDECFDKKYVQMWSVDYEYSPNATTFLWHQFINQVLPDRKIQVVLQMFLGATLIDRQKVKIEHILILLGKGANGKGVVNQVIKGVMGENMSSESIANLCDKTINGMAAVARINGRRLNFGTEMSAYDFKRRDAKLKTLVSGEAVTARMLYGQPFEAKDIPLLMSSANMIPYFDLSDDALIRRIYPIPFDIVIPEERRDPHLASNMVAEYPGIFNWIVEGRRLFVANGYKLPNEVYLRSIMSKGKADYETALTFMQKKGYQPKVKGVDIAPRNMIKAVVLYDEYKRWCEMNHLNMQTKISFFKSLENEGFVRVRRRDGYAVYVFGDITLSSFSRDADELRKKNLRQKAPTSKLIYVDGKAWVSSMKALAAYSGVGYKNVSSLNMKGMFDDFKKGWGEKTLYEVDPCMNVMRDLKIIATDQERTIQRKMQKELKYMRNCFNERMEYHGLPYRKYGNADQIDPDIKVVPDEMSDDEVFALAKEELGIEVNARHSDGIYSRGGKGYHDNVDDIPTEKEKKKFNRKKKEL